MDPSLMTDEELRARRIVVLGTCQHCGQIAAVHVPELADRDDMIDRFRAFVRAVDDGAASVAGEGWEQSDAERATRAAITAQDMGEE